MKKIFFLILLVAVAGCVQERNNVNSTLTNNITTEVNYNLNNVSSNTSNPILPAPAFDYFNYNPPATGINYSLIVPFPIVLSPMPYYVYNDTEIAYYKYNLTLVNLRKAFDAWENVTGFRVRFYQVSEKPANGVIIQLVTNLSGNVIGEARPLGHTYDKYSLITGGEMTLEPTYGGAENFVQDEHEIGHVLGLGHSKNPHSIMYPWNAFSEVMTPDIIDTINLLYQDVPGQNVTT